MAASLSRDFDGDAQRSRESRLCVSGDAARDDVLTIPRGIAAGVDKDATRLEELLQRCAMDYDSLGITMIEVGSVCPRPRDRPIELRHLPPVRMISSQPGTLVNRCGLPSDGAHAVCQRVAAAARGLGGSEERIVKIGVNFAFPDGFEWNRWCDELVALADYVVLNASCPNVEHGEDRRSLMTSVRNVVPDSVPLLLKVSPLEDPRRAAAAIRACRYSGVVAANARPLKSGGAISGHHLFENTVRLTRAYRTLLPKPEYTVISCGGARTITDAAVCERAGADAVQMHTAIRSRL